MWVLRTSVVGGLVAALLIAWSSYGQHAAYQSYYALGDTTNAAKIGIGEKNQSLRSILKI